MRADEIEETQQKRSGGFKQMQKKIKIIQLIGACSRRTIIIVIAKLNMERDINGEERK